MKKKLVSLYFSRNFLLSPEKRAHVVCFVPFLCSQKKKFFLDEDEKKKGKRFVEGTRAAKRKKETFFFCVFSSLIFHFVSFMAFQGQSGGKLRCRFLLFLLLSRNKKSVDPSGGKRNAKNLGWGLKTEVGLGSWIPRNLD